MCSLVALGAQPPSLTGLEAPICGEGGAKDAPSSLCPMSLCFPGRVQQGSAVSLEPFSFTSRLQRAWLGPCPSGGGALGCCQALALAMEGPTFHPFSLFGWWTGWACTTSLLSSKAASECHPCTTTDHSPSEDSGPLAQQGGFLVNFRREGGREGGVFGPHENKAEVLQFLWGQPTTNGGESIRSLETGGY